MQNFSLIESLANVIRDSNAQLNEQLAGNLKQLSQAVGAFTASTPAQLAPPEPAPSPTPQPAATPKQEPEPTPAPELGAVWAKECRRVDKRFRDTPHAKALFSGPRIDVSDGLSGAKAHARENHVVVIYSHPFEDQRPARWYAVIGMDGEAVSTHAVLDNDRDAWDALADIVRDAIVSDGDKVQSASEPASAPDSIPAPPSVYDDSKATKLTRQENHSGETFNARRHHAALRRHHMETLEARFNNALPRREAPEEVVEESVPPVLEKLESVRPAGEQERGSAPPSPPGLDSNIVLDTERVASVMADTERASSVLEDIFGAEEPEGDRKETPQDTGGVFSGLDPQHTDFVDILLTQSHWEKAEFETLAGQFGLMPEGALETVNEWSFEHFGDSLIIEEHERYSLDPEITAQLRE